MKELIAEWRKFVKEVKSLDDLTKDKDFASGFERSSGRRRNAYEVIQAFIKNSNEVNSLFQDSLKYMVNNDFDIYTPSGYSKPEFKAFAKKIAKAIGKKIKEEGVEKLIKDAVQISLTKDMGTDYFADPRARLLEIKSNNGQVTTGWPTLDKRLFGGMNRGELNIFAGGSGSGKSLFMQNIAINWITQGLNGVFLTLELSEELCAMRMDSMVANVSTREIFKDLDTLEMNLS